MKKIVIAITGATGAVYGIRLLEKLYKLDEVETHLVISEWAEKTIQLETSYKAEEVKGLADHVYTPGEMGAPIASGSFLSSGMVIVPCSMKTLSAVANGFADNLVVRAADVMLKERRTLILAVRETPLNSIHLENMLKVSQAGAVIAPPVPAFYNQPKTLDDIVEHFAGHTLDLLGLESSRLNRWTGNEV